jgi:hypothetical protein
MIVWVAATLAALVIGGVGGRVWWKRRKARAVAARRVIERPNSYYASKGVRDQEDREWWSQIRVDALHEVNREYVDRLLEQVKGGGIDSLNRDERAFLERMADLEAPPRRSVRPQPEPWPSPA